LLIRSYLCRKQKKLEQKREETIKRRKDRCSEKVFFWKRLEATVNYRQTFVGGGGERKQVLVKKKDSRLGMAWHGGSRLYFTSNNNSSNNNQNKNININNNKT
jgi:hypothetical protein